MTLNYHGDSCVMMAQTERSVPPQIGQGTMMVRKAYKQPESSANLRTAVKRTKCVHVPHSREQLHLKSCKWSCIDVFDSFDSIVVAQLLPWYLVALCVA